MRGLTVKILRGLFFPILLVVMLSYNANAQVVRKSARTIFSSASYGVDYSLPNSRQITANLNSIYGFGDKDLATEMILNVILHSGSTAKVEIPETLYSPVPGARLEALEISKYQALVPYELLVSIWISLVDFDNDVSLFPSYMRFMEVQKESLSHSPMGVNNDFEDRPEYDTHIHYALQSLNWMKEHPKEFQNAIEIFNSNYNLWKLEGEGSKSDYKEFLFQKTVKKYDLYKRFVPVDIEEYFDEGSREVIMLNSVSNEDIAMDTIEIVRVFDRLLDRQPTLNEIHFISEVWESGHMNLKMLQYAILNSDEFLHFQ